MNRSLLGWIAVFVLAIGGSAVAYVFFFAGGSGEPSTELTTPEVIGTTTTLGVDSTPPSTAPTTTEGSVEETAYVIDPGQSTVTFEINEVLRGEPKTVVGTTDQVAGQVVVDPSDLGASQFSEIIINARTFNTDSEQRNRAIRGPAILNSGSDEDEFITFTTTSVEGLDGVAAAAGETYEFSITGDLTIRGATNPTTFDVSVEMVDDSTIRGTATADVLRSEFGIGIPSVPFVADVTDEVALNVDFVATAG